MAENPHYVVEGAPMLCTMCAAPGATVPIQCPFDHGFYVKDLPLMIVTDHTVLNIPPFPGCLSLGACDPSGVLEWREGKEDFFLLEKRVLTRDSSAICAKGAGVLTFQESGQEE